MGHHHNEFYLRSRTHQPDPSQWCTPSSTPSATRKSKSLRLKYHLDLATTEGHLRECYDDCSFLGCCRHQQRPQFVWNMNLKRSYHLDSFPVLLLARTCSTACHPRVMTWRTRATEKETHITALTLRLRSGRLDVFWRTLKDTSYTESIVPVFWLITNHWERLPCSFVVRRPLAVHCVVSARSSVSKTETNVLERVQNRN